MNICSKNKNIKNFFKQTIKKAFVLLFLLILNNKNIKTSFALTINPSSCSEAGIFIENENEIPTTLNINEAYPFVLNFSTGVPKDTSYKIMGIIHTGSGAGVTIYSNEGKIDENNLLKLTLDLDSNKGTNISLYLVSKQTGEEEYTIFCSLGSRALESVKYKVDELVAFECPYDEDGKVTTDCSTNPELKKCYQTGCLDIQRPLFIKGKIVKNDEPLANKNITIKVGSADRLSTTTDKNGIFTVGPFRFSANDANQSVSIKIKTKYNPLWNITSSSYSIFLYTKCPKESCSTDPTEIDSFNKVYKICAQVQADDIQKCQQCLTHDHGIWTSIGCIPAKTTSIIKAFIVISVMLSGGVVTIMILIAGFKLSISHGNPSQVQEAKKMISSAIIGLLFVLFSVSIIKIIGIDILHIPGFENTNFEDAGQVE